MNKKYILFLFFGICIANAQSSKITTKDFNLLGKVKQVMETSEKQGDLITEKEKNDTNVFYDETFSPIVGIFLFNKEGNIIEKRGFPDIDKKTLYVYDTSNKLISETTYLSKLKSNKNKPINNINYIHKTDTIVYTKTILEDKTIKPLVVNQVFKNKLLLKEFTEQKYIYYSYDDKGTLIKKEGWKKEKSQKNKTENYQIIYENDIMISNFCPEKNITKTFYPNGLLKSYKSENRFQEWIYTYDEKGNWITSTVTLDGKPSIKYYRIIEYFE
jgi:hypothetical protein